MDAIRASWRIAHAHHLGHALERHAAVRGPGATAEPVSVAAVPPTAPVAASGQPGASSEQRGDEPAPGRRDAEQRSAELQRQRELWIRDMEVRADLASKAELEPPRMPPIFEFEYGSDGRTYAVERIHHEAPPAETTTSPPPASQHEAVPAEAIDVEALADPREADPEPDPPEPRRTEGEEVVLARPRSFVDPGHHVQPGAHLDDVV